MSMRSPVADASMCPGSLRLAANMGTIAAPVHHKRRYANATAVASLACPSPLWFVRSWKNRVLGNRALLTLYTEDRNIDPWASHLSWRSSGLTRGSAPPSTPLLRAIRKDV